MHNMSHYSETTEKDWNDFWAEDGFSMTGNPAGESPDTIVFGGSRVIGGQGSDTINFGGDGVFAAQPVPGPYLYLDGGGEDHISLTSSTFNLNLPEDTNKNGFWKYEEDKTLKEVQDYLSGTYNSHYTSKDSKTQTLDLIESIGDAEAFCRSNAIKYLSRFGKKEGKSKRDILKAIHYCVLLYHFAGLHKQTSTYPY